MSALMYRERPADGDARRACSSSTTAAAPTSTTCSPLADVLDPQRRLHVVTPRAPLTLPGWPGHHWYVVPRVGYPDPDTFHAAYAQLAAFHDELWERTGMTPERTVLGGFSMGSVMSYALGLGADRPAPGGHPRLLGLRSDRRGLGAGPGRPTRPARVHRPRPPRPGHGRRVRAPRARLLEAGGLDVEYHESDAGHHIDPATCRLRSTGSTRRCT